MQKYPKKYANIEKNSKNMEKMYKNQGKTILFNLLFSYIIIEGNKGRNGNVENEKKVISAFAVDDNEFVENILNILDTISKVLEEYDEIDLSDANDCPIVKIKRTPTILEMNSKVDKDKMILACSTNCDNFKIYLERRLDNN